VAAIFENAPIEPTVVAIQVREIFFDTQFALRRCIASATTNIRPVDHIGRGRAARKH